MSSTPEERLPQDGPDQPSSTDAGPGAATGAGTPPDAGQDPVAPPADAWSAPESGAPSGEPWAGMPPSGPAASETPQPGLRYDVPQEQKNLAMISTLGMLIAGVISPLVVLLLTNDSPAKRFANDHAKAGLNFCITAFAGWAIAILLAFVFIGFLLMPLLLGWSIWVIVAGAIQANNGEAPNYPLVPTIIK